MKASITTRRPFRLIGRPGRRVSRWLKVGRVQSGGSLAGGLTAFGIYVADAGLTYSSQLLIARLVGMDISASTSMPGWSYSLIALRSGSMSRSCVFVPAYSLGVLLNGVILYAQRARPRSCWLRGSWGWWRLFFRSSNASALPRSPRALLGAAAASFLQSLRRGEARLRRTVTSLGQSYYTGARSRAWTLGFSLAIEPRKR